MAKKGSRDVPANTTGSGSDGGEVVKEEEMAGVARRTGWPASQVKAEANANNVAGAAGPITKNGTNVANIAALTINRTIHL